MGGVCGSREVGVRCVRGCGCVGPGRWGEVWEGVRSVWDQGGGDEVYEGGVGPGWWSEVWEVMKGMWGQGGGGEVWEGEGCGQGGGDEVWDGVRAVEVRW